MLAGDFTGGEVEDGDATVEARGTVYCLDPQGCCRVALVPTCHATGDCAIRGLAVC